MIFTDPQGRTLQVNSPDGSIPSETELDQMFKIKYGNISNSDVIPKSNQIIDSIKRIPDVYAKSAGKLASGLWNAATHPIDTLKSTAIAAIHPIDTIKSFVKDRYDTPQNTMNTLANDPFGVMADFSMITGGAGAITKGSRLGNALTTTANAVDPLANTVKAVGAGTKFATASRTIRPFGNNLDTEAINSAKQAGIELPASAINQNKAIPLVEAGAGKGFFGKNIGDRINNAYNMLNQYADRVIFKTGASSDMSVAGQKILQGVDAFRNRFLQIKNSLYNEAKLPETGVPVNANNSLPYIKQILADKIQSATVLGKSTDIGYFQNLEDKLSNGIKSQSKILDERGNPIGGSTPVEASQLKSVIRELNTKLSDSNDAIATGNRGILIKLVSKLSEDLDSAIVAKRPDLADAIDKANAFYSEGINKLNSGYGEALTKFGKAEQFDKVVPALINPSTSIEDIPKIYEVIGQNNVPSLQAAFLDDFFKKARSLTDGNFTAAGITRQIKTIGGDKKLQTILTPDQYQGVKNIENIAKAMGRTSSVLKGSQTAFIGRIALEIGKFGSNFPVALATIVGDSLVSRFIGSATGQKLLSTGINLTGKTGNNISKSVPIAGTVGRLLRVGNISNRNQ